MMKHILRAATAAACTLDGTTGHGRGRGQVARHARRNRDRDHRRDPGREPGGHRHPRQPPGQRCPTPQERPVHDRAHRITGDIALEENLGQVDLDTNDVVGSIQANKNTGGLVITTNMIGNGLRCQDNSPPPTGGGNIAKQKQGQCVDL